MASGISTTLTFGIEHAVKDGLRAASERKHRNNTTKVAAVIICDYCGRNSVTIPEQRGPRPDGETGPTGRADE